MADEIKIKVTADTKSFEKDMDAVDRKLDQTADKSEKSQSKWGQFNSKLSAISPSFKKISDTWQESSGKIDGAFGKSTGAAKLFKLGVIGALAGIALKAGKVAWQFANDTARMFDPKGYSKAAGAMQKSVKKLKTTIGSFTAPLVNGIMTVVSKVVDGITWILEKIRILRSFIWGIIKGMIRPVIDGLKQIVEWIKSGINTLANFLGFGDVFKSSSESAKDAADSMGEVVEATSAGLAGFDKLNTLDMSNSGDAEQADKLKDGMEEASKLGEKLGEKLNIKGIVKELTSIDWGGLYDGFCETLGKIPKWFKKNVTDKILNVDWGGLWNGFCETLGGAGDWFRDNVLNPILSFDWGGLWNGFCETLGGAGNWFMDTVLDPVLSFDWGGLWNGFCETLGGLKDWLLGKLTDVLSFDWGGLWTGFTDAMGETRDWILQKLTDATGFDWIELWNRFTETMGKIATFIKDKILEGINGAVGGVTSFVKDPVGGITSIPGKVTSKIKGALGLASGGAVAPNNPRPYILGDNTREYEVISPVSLMKDAVKSAISEMGGAGRQSSGPIELVVNLDGRKIARAVYDPLQTESRRRGSRA